MCLIDFLERVAQFNWLFGDTRKLHLIAYLEPPVAPNRQLNGATLSLWWLQIAFPNKNIAIYCHMFDTLLQDVYLKNNKIYIDISI